MSTDDAFREHLLTLLRGTIGRPFEDSVRDFPAASMNVKPPHVDYTPWHLLEHLRISQRDILDYIRDPHYTAPEWPEGYWPAKGATADAAAWAASVEGFRSDRQALEEMVRDAGTDLVAPMPRAPEHTVLREVFLVAGHSAFHIGEFGILREVMQTWPAGHNA